MFQLVYRQFLETFITVPCVHKAKYGRHKDFPG